MTAAAIEPCGCVHCRSAWDCRCSHCRRQDDIRSSTAVEAIAVPARDIASELAGWARDADLCNGDWRLAQGRVRDLADLLAATALHLKRAALVVDAARSVTECRSGYVSAERMNALEQALASLDELNARASR